MQFYVCLGTIYMLIFLRQQTYCDDIDFLHIFSYQYKTN